MKLSRREFLKYCLYTAALGFGLKGIRPVYAARVSSFEPAYTKLHKDGELKKRAEALWAALKSCRLCPRACGTDRLSGEEGFCRASSQLEVSACQAHFGEEEELVGSGGSGTIFFTNCGLRCEFCINWDISIEGKGYPRSISDLADMMLHLQSKRCENINLVTPTHYLPHIMLALDQAAARGLRLPLVYNTCGWDRVTMLNMLDGVVDIYLPDFKYSSGDMSAKYSSGADKYPHFTKEGLLQMYRQVGTAKPDSDGIIRRGLMIRHLVMPNNVGGTSEVIDWIAANLPKDTYLNLMSQYRPYYKASDHPKIARKITRQEYESAILCAKEAGLTNIHLQPRPID
jgi:putative pyruvate formate lyase activating enzyme